MNKKKISAIEEALKTAHNRKSTGSPKDQWQQGVMREIRKGALKKQAPQGLSIDLTRLLWPLVPITCGVIAMTFFSVFSPGGTDSGTDLIYLSINRPLEVEYLYLNNLL